MAYDYDDDTPVSQLPDDQKLQCFKEWVKLSRDSFAEQRRLEREDLLAQDPKNQWPEEAKKARAGRPMVAISLLAGPLQHVYNQAQSAQFGVDLKPINEKAQTRVAEAKKGMFSRIQRDGGAGTARLWAFDRMEQCGMGWYSIITAWDEDSDNPSDQEIRYRRLLFQEMVWPDPAAIEPDFSDARFIGLGAHMVCRDFRRAYPKAQYATNMDFLEVAATEPEWVLVDGQKNNPLVVELFYKESSYEVVSLDAASGTFERMKERAEVRRAVFTAKEVLEDRLWLEDKLGRGRKYIPVVPVIGKECIPVDGKRVWKGMVRDAMDGQLTFNYGISQTIEDVSSSSKAKYLVVAGQIEGFEDQWNNAHRTPQMYLPYNAIDINGTPAPPPQLVQVDGSKMQLSLALAQQARELVQTSTQGFEPLEVPKRKAEQSGRAIAFLEQKAEAGRSHYIENFKNISLPLDARIVLDMMPVVYDRPGRVTHILGLDEDTSPVMLNQHFVMKDGRPMAVPEGTPGAEFIDLSEGAYSIVPTMGKAPQTRLEEGQEFLQGVVQAAPEAIMPIAADLLFQFRDEPGAKQLAERFKRHIRATMPHVLDDENAQAEDAKAENAALKQQMQLMGQQLQEAMKALETDKVKADAQVAIAQLKAQTDVALAEMNNAAKLAVERIKAGLDAASEEAGLREERLATGLKLAHETVENEKDREHEREMAHFNAAHDVGMAAGGAKSMTMKREGGREQEGERSSEQSTGSESEASHGASSEPQADGADR